MGSIAKSSWLLMRQEEARRRDRGRRPEGEVRFLGDVENSPFADRTHDQELADRYDRLQVCFEAGPMGYGLYRQVEALGHDCMVAAQALIPKRSRRAQDEPGATRSSWHDCNGPAN